MVDLSPKFGLSFLAEGGESAELYVNENMVIIESMAQLLILDRDLATPPGSPTQGATYLIATSPTGAWSGQAGKLTIWTGTRWVFISPVEGMSGRVADEDKTIQYTGSTWVVFGTTTISDGGTLNWNAAAGNVATVTIAGTRTMAAPSNILPGQVYTLLITQGGSGANDINWNAVFHFPGGSPPTLTDAVGATDLIVFVATSTTALYNIASVYGVT